MKASNTGTDDRFGEVLALSGDGSVMAVGVPFEDSSATGVGGSQVSNAAIDSGAVYVLRRSVAGAWAQEAYVKASNAGASDQFGISVALSYDGSFLAVGAYGESSSATGIGGTQSSDAAVGSGAVYVFHRSLAGVWAQEAYVKASNTEAGDAFGADVALAADGSGLVVGAPGEDSGATTIGGSEASNAALGSGAVYAFTRSAAGAWSQEAYIKTDTFAGDWFGYHLDVSADGSVLAATAVYSTYGSSEAGQAYVFRRAAGGIWEMVTSLHAPNYESMDHFGSSVAVSGDGAVIAVGAPSEDSAASGVGGNQLDNTRSSSGAVYLYRASGYYDYLLEAYVKASNTDASDSFGWSVALSATGDTLAVGAYQEASFSTGVGADQADNSAFAAGAAYVLRRSLTGTWSQESYVKASNTQSSDYFGICVDLSDDGVRLAVGGSREDSGATGVGGDQTSETTSNSGAVYVFR